MKRLIAFVLLLCSAQIAHAEDVRLVAAGSLKAPLSALIDSYNKSHDSHIVAEWGPAGSLHDRLVAGEPFDIFAPAAFALAQSLTNQGLSGPSVVFVRNALCVVVPQDSPVTAENLVSSLLRPEIIPGTSTPKSDPAGDYTWEVFHRIDRLHPGAYEDLNHKAQQLFGGVPSTKEAAKGGNILEESLDSHAVSLVISYCSGSAQMVRKSGGKYRLISLPPDLDVQADYGLTLAKGASRAAADFAFYILSPAGQRVLADFGFLPVSLSSAP